MCIINIIGNTLKDEIPFNQKQSSCKCQITQAKQVNFRFLKIDQFKTLHIVLFLLRHKICLKTFINISIMNSNIFLNLGGLIRNLELEIPLFYFQ